MIHKDLRGIKFDTILPPGYYFRNFRDGDIDIWVDIEKASGEFVTIKDAIKRFRDEFDDLKEELESRCFFLCNEIGEPVGTAMGWFGDLHGEKLGRLHWISIKPEYQGRRLGKPLVAKAMERIQKSHDKAYLTSQTTSWRAINMYLDFGFQPLYIDDNCKKAWMLLKKKLGHPSLDIKQNFLFCE